MRAADAGSATTEMGQPVDRPKARCGELITLCGELHARLLAYLRQGNANGRGRRAMSSMISARLESILRKPHRRESDPEADALARYDARALLRYQAMIGTDLPPAERAARAKRHADKLAPTPKTW